MFLLLGVFLMILMGAFVAGALSRLTKPRTVAFKATPERRAVVQAEVVRPSWSERGPQVWEQNLVGIDAKPKAKQSMGNWD